MSLASTFWAGGVRAAGTLAWTFSIQVYMNSWKRLLFGAEAGARADVSTGPDAGTSRPRAGRLMTGFPQRAGGIIVGERRRQKKKGGSFLPSKWAG